MTGNPKIYLKNDRNISIRLAKLFNILLSNGVFPSQLKTAKVIPIHKKETKLCSNYRPISFLSNLDKIIKGSCIT